ncbi:hypothetical protein PROFUN_01396 [Planoprotostelium fungivorum]|uniref:Protein kinase domain-containing protein n=1 Tax=Planoprotostelium fungivorum TaxID=1890364 RepID=A0A2P6NT56_9EUKA|nr:hypothetical protein PROFUN_01396 [Planoprotostelium fungivorum]
MIPARFLFLLLIIHTWADVVPSSTLSTLQIFFEAAGGHSWTTSTGWNTTDICSFYGITCGRNSDGHSIVTRVALPNNNVTVASTLSLSALTFLQEIDLSFNPLGCTFTDVLIGLPPHIGSVKMVTCGLIGSVDVNSNLPNLTTLDLSDNHATQLLSDLSSATQLVYLNLSSNYATGSLSFLYNNELLQTLDLNRNRLTGTLQPLQNLTKLVYIDLDNNLLSGSIPDFFGQFSNLRYLDMGLNQLSGTLPSGLVVLPHLFYLYLPFNLFDGELPKIWTSPLVVLSMGACQLIGEVPTSIYNISTMQVMIFGANRLVGTLPSDLSRFPMLNQYHMTANHFRGELPTVYPPNVASLNFDYNEFTGSIPSSICSLKNLQEFIVTSNQISGTIPDCIGQMTSLVSLKMGGNSISGTLPTGMSQLRLQIANLYDNLIEGDIGPLMNITSLLRLDLTSNRLSGVVPYRISQLTNLNWLALGSNNFSGNIPVDRLSKMNLQVMLFIHGKSSHQIQRLDLSYNNLQGGVPCFGSSLQYLDVSHNELTSIDNTCFNSNFNLRYIDLSWNQISSTIPAGPASANVEIFKVNNNKLYGWMVSGREFRDYLVRITYFDVSCNQLEGNILFGLNQCPQLQYLNMSHNLFVGNMPPLFPPMLTTLDVSDNHLTGNLPDANSLNLQLMVVKNNKFNGTIPNNLGQLRFLQTLDLSQNLLTGQIPDSLSNASLLTYLDLSSNQLTSQVPPSFTFLRSLTLLNLSLNHLSGSMPLLHSDPSTIDLSGNSFTGGLDFMASVTSLQTLNLAGNMFTGAATVISKQFKLVHLNLGDNALTGDLPNLSGSSLLQTVDISNNGFSGMIQIDSKLTYADGLVLNNDTVCNLHGNPLICPLPWPVFQNCMASCEVFNYTSTTLQVTLQTTSAFDVTIYNARLAALSNSTLSRFTTTVRQISQKRTSSIVAETSISPPTLFSFNEGSAVRVAQFIVQIFQNDPSALSSSGITIVSSVSPTPSTPSSDNLSKSTIIGIVVGCTAAVMIILIVGLIVLFVYRRKLSLRSHDFSDIDLSSINLGAAKKSVINHEELTDLHMIGSGAFGVVYKASWRDITVAVKQIKSEHINEEQLKSFLKEVAILQSLRAHPNVVMFMGVTFPPQPLSLITEFCEGGCLYTFMRETHVSWDQRLSFMQGIDLAMRNILLTKNMEPKVADFGMSREQENESAGVTNSNVGPLKWMAPEAIQHQMYSTKSDVFSFAVTMWEILTVEEPWSQKSGLEAAICVATREERMPIPSSCEPAISALITQCWSHDPEKRPDFKEITQYLGCRQINEATFQHVKGSNSDNSRSSVRKSRAIESTTPTTSSLSESGSNPTIPNTFHHKSVYSGLSPRSSVQV